MNNKINVALQILPTSKSEHPYTIIDKAISLIKESGLKHRVCPFETVIEGEYDEIMLLLKDIHHECYKIGADSIIANLKLQSKKNEDVFIEDKMIKYDKSK